MGAHQHEVDEGVQLDTDEVCVEDLEPILGVLVAVLDDLVEDVG